MEQQTIFIIIGVISLFGSFATINSRFVSAYDHEFSLLLLVVGIITLGIGFGFIDNFLSSFLELYRGIGASE